MRTHIDYSFCIVNWNGGQQLLHCLDSIEREQQNNPSLTCETILVDNHSADLSRSELAKYTHLQFIQNQSNELFAKGTNQSVEHSAGAVLIILNNDIVLQPGFLQKTHAYVQRHPTVDCLVPKLVLPDGSVQKSVSGLPKVIDLVYYAFGLHLWSQRCAHWMNPVFSYTNETVIAKQLQPAFSALVIRRSCWDRVGGLDEAFPLLWNDVDWFTRFHKLNQKAVYLPTITAMHRHGFSVNRSRFKKIFVSTQYMQTYMQKHNQWSPLQKAGLQLLYTQLLLLRLLREVVVMFRERLLTLSKD